MTEREAIKMIIENYPKGGVMSNHYTKVIEALDLAIAALETQIPKNPYIEKRQHGHIKVCPRCQITISPFTDPNGCKICLQRLNWSEEE